MAKLIYDENGRLIFTKEMKSEYTLLMPQMLPVHFTMLKKCLEIDGYKVDLLKSDHQEIVNTGLKYVHNDTCYPALLVIGQLIDALQSGQYDPHKVGLLITQTGGGCRASNYIHLLRKALKKAGYEYVPVVSVNLAGLEKNPGFNLNYSFIIRMLYVLYFGDLLSLLANQCKPYEINLNQTDQLVEKWESDLVAYLQNNRILTQKMYQKKLIEIATSFEKIPRSTQEKIKVGIVGEIYIKYSSFGNNKLEEFLLSEGAEPIVPGVADFMIYSMNNYLVDIELYGGSMMKKKLLGLFQGYFEKLQTVMIDVILEHTSFRAPEPFKKVKQSAIGYVGHGNKMGEGWLLTAEMVDLIKSGVNNIICAQPFGCLPNHISGKGMLRKIKNNYPLSNIVSIDYDPGATRVNQENRIKLMIANAKLAK
ncbi:MAG: 2-hydroxyacyl-CoA dehydratase [Erysipelotrichaceae bacterium]